MRVGVVYYSYSGHTALLVARLVSELSRVRGGQVREIPLEPEGSLQFNAISVPLKSMPTIEECDALILGTPVHGGRMSGPMRTFLEDISSLEDLRVAFLLTHFFPRQWGAVQTAEAMDALCREKGAEVLGSADVTWFSLHRENQINACISHIASLLEI